MAEFMLVPREEREEFRRIVNLLKKEEIVAFPTDTVFGIGVIYNDAQAIAKMK